MLVACGVVLLAVTLKFPPYFGSGGSDVEITMAHSGANRIRCAVDLAVLWIYVCSFVAACLHAGDSHGAIACVNCAKNTV